MVTPASSRGGIVEGPLWFQTHDQTHSLKALPIHPTTSHKKHKWNHSTAELTNRGQLTLSYTKFLFRPKATAKSPRHQWLANWHHIFLPGISNARIEQSFAGGTNTCFQTIKINLSKEINPKFNLDKCSETCNSKLEILKPSLLFRDKSWILHTVFILQQKVMWRNIWFYNSCWL